MRYTTLIFVCWLSLSSHVFGASFPDTTYSFYRDAIDTLSSEKVISGFGDGTFRPYATITRAEFLKILMKAEGIDTNSGHTSACFTDVKTSMWYHTYICEAAKRGIVKGFSDGTFGPNNPVTTLEALAIGMRLYKLVPSDGTPWYLPYQDLANRENILRTSDYTLSTPLSRGKASEYIMKLRAYAKTKTLQTSRSLGCSQGSGLGENPTIEIAGKTRSYILSLPAGYTSGNAYKLIIANHGRTNSNTMVRDYMGLESRGWGGGGASDFIVAYPSALTANGGGYTWSSDENITFVDAIIREIGDNYCIDRDQVYVVGHSLGAWFSSKLACMRGDIWRGMAIVGGGGFTTPCNNSPTATLIYQNADDTLSSPASARSVEKTMKTLNSCGNTLETVAIGNLSCQKWRDCSSGNPVIWCEGYPTLGGNPHSWPTGGGGAIRDFFQALP